LTLATLELIACQPEMGEIVDPEPSGDDGVG
jgi:hypothetical protein